MTDNEIRMECLRLAASRPELTACEVTKTAVSFENYVRGIRTTEANTGHPAQMARGLVRALGSKPIKYGADSPEVAP